jgi:uncharacterized protein YndB with AHSA1/START domain
MSVKIDPSGRRSVQVEVEVPGTPEQVWQAIATGPGISAWFVPTDMEERTGGAMVAHFGPGMDATATVTLWDPPRRFAAEGSDFAPNAPPLATEWIVEARSGGTCLVRVVHSLFASEDDWDNQLESTEAGWPTFFRILQVYLEHFPGQRCSNISLMGIASGDTTEAWNSLVGSLGFASTRPGDRCTSSGDGVPPISGTVEPLSDIPNGRRIMLRLDEPASGVAMLGAFDCAGSVMVSINLYIYGERATDVTSRDEPLWHSWLSGAFPSVGMASSGS